MFRDLPGADYYLCTPEQCGELAVECMCSEIYLEQMLLKVSHLRNIVLSEL